MERTDSAGHQRGGKGREAFRTISEVAEYLDLPQHVLRFWESKFSQIKPIKRGGNRRYYRPDDVTLLSAIKQLLHADGYTIRGVQKLFRAQGLKATIALALDENGAAAPARRQTIEVVKVAENVKHSPESKVINEGDTFKGSSSLPAVIERLKNIRAKLD